MLFKKVLINFICIVKETTGKDLFTLKYQEKLLTLLMASVF